MKVYQSIIIFILFILITACSGEDQSKSNEQSSYDIIRTQKLAMEKARQVEQVLQNGADKKSQFIDEQSQ